MRIFVTGATGYIGGVLCRALRASGRQVTALARATSDSSKVNALSDLGVKIELGDVLDRPSMRAGMAGADWVVHAAAEVTLSGPPERMRATNVEGSENVASLAWKLGVGRLLSVSSVAYFGGSPADGSLGDETTPPAADFPSPYSATKHAGERAIRVWADQGLRVNTVYPSLVYGPPGKKEGANAQLRALIKGRIPFLVGGDRLLSWVHIDDVVAGMLAVIEQAPVGRDYLLAGEAVTLREIAHRVCALAGTAPPRRELPLWAARLALALLVPIYRLRGRRSPMPPSQLESLKHHWAFSDTRARRELGWTPRGLEQGLPPTVALLAAT